MNIIRKILKCPVWAFAVISLTVAYCAGEWYAHVMFQRWAESDGADSEAYAVVNHHSNITCILVATIIVFVFWGVRRYFRKKFCKQT